jgi:hydroxypyruvate reductase/glycerate 2-kinase
LLKLPLAVNHFLKNAGPEFEAPKEADLAGHHRHDFIIVKGTAACEAAAERARALGFNTLILSTMLEGESKELGRTFAAIAAEILRNNRPLSLPCVVIGGGETTVKIDGDAGEGGPNQEFAVSAALSVDDIGNVVVIGLDTDGTDGPTDWAGAMVDAGTASRARKAGLDLFENLRRHDVSACLQSLGDVIRTGATGTNVNDLKIMAIFPHPGTSEANQL